MEIYFQPWTFYVTDATLIVCRRLHKIAISTCIQLIDEHYRHSERKEIKVETI